MKKLIIAAIFLISFTFTYAQIEVYPTTSAANYGGAPRLQGIDSTVCPDGDDSDADCWSAAIDIRGKSGVSIYIEGETAASTVTIQLYVRDENAVGAWIPFIASKLDSTIAHDATNSPTVGTGLACSTACFTSIPWLVGTLGHASLKINVTASGVVTEEVDIWLATLTGQDLQ